MQDNDMQLKQNNVKVTQSMYICNMYNHAMYIMCTHAVFLKCKVTPGPTVSISFHFFKKNQ